MKAPNHDSEHMNFVLYQIHLNGPKMAMTMLSSLRSRVGILARQPEIARWVEEQEGQVLSSDRTRIVWLSQEGRMSGCEVCKPAICRHASRHNCKGIDRGREKRYGKQRKKVAEDQE